MRDWQQRTLEWLQGKTFDGTTPLGPEMVTADEFDPRAPHAIVCQVEGEVVQRSTTDSLTFNCPTLLSYISQFATVCPGGVVLTGTPAGTGMGLDPPRYISRGDWLDTSIEGIGALRNIVA